MNKHEIFKYFNNGDMGMILEGYFKQVKEGGN